MSLVKKFWIIIAIIILVLIVTNPGPKAFKEYLGEGQALQTRRVYNWLIFSVYETQLPFSNHQYLGIFMNFFPREIKVSE
ncbi:hypothetical protein [Ferruginibacter sp. SUN106]|uniref:hypothetical protein n=1 Tax=Ferruginibacter sp. SUN106 TaxID=2978348 RepID=UPI003D36902B